MCLYDAETTTEKLVQLIVLYTELFGWISHSEGTTYETYLIQIKADTGVRPNEVPGAQNVIRYSFSGSSICWSYNCSTPRASASLNFVPCAVDRGQPGTL